MRMVQAKDIPEEEIYAACRAFQARQAGPPDEALAHKYPPKVVLAKMEKMVQAGKLDYGVSLRTAWVVEE